jgi:hypothetical protein
LIPQESNPSYFILHVTAFEDMVNVPVLVDGDGAVVSSDAYAEKVGELAQVLREIIVP